MSKLCLVMIVKDEERVIERALTSALRFIDSYSIVDTGSTDKTKEIIAGFMDKHRVQGVIHDRPWVGFGHNRTEAIDLARERFSTKFGLILDADDTIEAPAGYELPELTADQYDNPVPHGDYRSGQPHVIRLAMPFFFKGVTHEYLDCKVPCVKSTLPEMLYRIGTDGNVRAAGTKFKRDIDLLLKAVRRDPKDARSYFYLAQSYRDDGQLRPAFNTYLRRAELGGGWDEEVYIAKLEVAKLAEKLEMSEHEIVGLYLDAHKVRPQRAEAMFYLGRYYRKAENYGLAIMFADAACAIPCPADRLFIESSIYDWHAQAEYAISAQRLGKHAEAIAANMKALAKCPRSRRTWIAKNLSFSLPSQREPQKLDLRACPPDVGGLHSGLNVVLNGSYDIPDLSFDEPPTIVDIGAHVGSASVFFSRRFPGARIYAYEPSPDNAQYCEKNLAGIAELKRCAIVGPGAPKEMWLHEGIHNTGQRSLYKLGEQRDEGVMVPTMCATELPPCDVLKCDAEGVELDILRSYPHLSGVRAMMLEWHRLEDYRELLRWLPTLGFELVRDDAKGRWIADRNLIFVRKEANSVVKLRREYRLEQLPDLVRPVVIDAGANAGNFARYVMKRWPGATVHCYEPNPQTFAALNGASLAGVVSTQAALTHGRKEGKVKLYMGVNGSEECSLRDDVRWPHLSQRLDTWVEVETIDSATLPKCDVFKCDTEGSELEILSGYPYMKDVSVLLVEPHPVGGDLDSQVRQIVALAEASGLRRFDDGYILRFVRS